MGGRVGEPPQIIKQHQPARRSARSQNPALFPLPLRESTEKTPAFGLMVEVGNFFSDRMVLFFQITDQPRERPNMPLAPEAREKHVILSLSVPPSAHVADTIPLVNAVFQLVDSLNKISLRPETKTKLKKFREDLDKSIKEDAEKEAKEEVRSFIYFWTFVNSIFN